MLLQLIKIFNFMYWNQSSTSTSRQFFFYFFKYPYIFKESQFLPIHNRFAVAFLASLPASKSSMNIQNCSQLADLVSLLSLYFLKHPNLPKEPHYLLHFTILSQQCPYFTLDIVFLSAVPPIGAVFQAMFFCYALVSTCCISTF